MKKVLFLVNGFGLGNASRVFSIISCLKKATPYVATSSSGYEYFISRKFTKIYKLKSFSYFKGNKIGVFSFTIAQFYNILSFSINLYKITVILIKLRPSLIFIDSDYSMLFFKIFFKTPIYSINNSIRVIDFFKSNKKLKYLPQIIFEYLDYSFQLLIPGKIFVPDFFEIKENKNKFISVGPVCPPPLSSNPFSGIINNVLIMASGSSMGRIPFHLSKLSRLSHITFHFIGNFNIVEQKNIKVYPKYSNNNNILNICDLFVTNSGTVAISEACKRNKLIILYDIPKHAEQFYNSSQIINKGRGVRGDDDCFSKSLSCIYKILNDNQKSSIQANNKLRGELIISNEIEKQVLKDS